MFRIVIALAVLAVAGCGGENLRRNSSTAEVQPGPAREIPSEVPSRPPTDDSEWEALLDSLEVIQDFDEEPQMIEEAQPMYPQSSLQKGEQGVVWVEALVDENGDVLAARVGKSSGHPALDNATISTAFYNKFKPAIKDGEPVKCVVKYNIEYRLPR